jgi:hypothetical protein
MNESGNISAAIESAISDVTRPAQSRLAYHAPQLTSLGAIQTLVQSTHLNNHGDGSIEFDGTAS